MPAVVRALRRADRAALRALRDRNLVDLTTLLPSALLTSDLADAAYPYVVLDRSDIVGAIALFDVIRGDAQQADLAFWVDRQAWGRGIATAAVAHLRAVAHDAIGLHRLVSATQLANGAAQRVLEKNQFELIGRAREYRYVAGRWQDHLLFQRLLPDW